MTVTEQTNNQHYHHSKPIQQCQLHIWITLSCGYCLTAKMLNETKENVDSNTTDMARLKTKLTQYKTANESVNQRLLKRHTNNFPGLADMIT